MSEDDTSVVEIFLAGAVALTVIFAIVTVAHLVGLGSETTTDRGIEVIEDTSTDDWLVLFECSDEWILLDTAETEDEANALAEELSQRDDLNRFCNIRSSSEVQP